MSSMKFWLPLPVLQRGNEGRGRNYVAKQKEIKELVAVSWPLRGRGSLSASVKKEYLYCVRKIWQLYLNLLS